MNDTAEMWSDYELGLTRAETTKRAPRVVGLDLSLTASGMSDGLTTWVVRSSGRKADSLSVRTLRLGGLRGVILSHVGEADLVVIEQPAYSRQAGHAHDRSGLWWLVNADLHDRGIPVAEISPSALKKYVTGRGNADKFAMVDTTARRCPDIETGADDNRVDALWLALAGIERLTGQGRVPAAQSAVLNGVQWPEIDSW